MSYRLKVKRMGLCWWIVGDEEYGPYGPHNTKEEADDNKRGLMRLHRHGDEPGYVTSEPKEEED